MVYTVAACRLQSAARLQWGPPRDNSAAGDDLYFPLEHATGGPVGVVVRGDASDRAAQIRRRHAPIQPRISRLPIASSGTEHFGATSSTWTFNKAVAGFATKSGATASVWTFSKAVVGFKTTTGATASVWTFNKAVAGYATKTGATASVWTFNATTNGVRVRFGATASVYTFGKAVAGFKTTGGVTASTWTFGKAVAGFKTTTSSTSSVWTFNATTAGEGPEPATGGPTGIVVYGQAVARATRRRHYDIVKYGRTIVTWNSGMPVAPTVQYGVTSSTWTFNATTTAKITAFSSLSFPITFNVTVTGFNPADGMTAIVCDTLTGSSISCDTLTATGPTNDTLTGSAISDDTLTGTAITCDTLTPTAV